MFQFFFRQGDDSRYPGFYNAMSCDLEERAADLRRKPAIFRSHPEQAFLEQCEQELERLKEAELVRDGDTLVVNIALDGNLIKVKELSVQVDSAWVRLVPLK